MGISIINEIPFYEILTNVLNFKTKLCDKTYLIMFILQTFFEKCMTLLDVEIETILVSFSEASLKIKQIF